MEFERQKAEQLLCRDGKVVIEKASFKLREQKIMTK